jgi:hypothetical protein
MDRSQPFMTLAILADGVLLNIGNLRIRYSTV